MQFADMNWADVESYLKHDDRVVLVTGACEQHAALSLLTDVRVPMALAEAACHRETVLLAPPLNFGVSPYFTAYPGTISLTPETFAGVVREVLNELLRQGFRKILVSNGHGGNTSIVQSVLIELGGQRPDAAFDLFEWWKHPAIAAVAKAADLVPSHANWLENFTFTRVGPVPDGEKMMVDLPGAASPQTYRETLGDGSYGGPYQAPDTVSEALFAAAVEAMVIALRKLRG